MRFSRFQVIRNIACLLLTGLIVLSSGEMTRAQAIKDVRQEDVERSIREGIRFLKSRQKADGSWSQPGFEQHNTGVTSLVTLALLTAGEDPKLAQIQKALAYLRQYRAEDLDSVYAVSLQTMALAAAEPEADKVRLTANVQWLENAQIKPNDRISWAGTWSYTGKKTSQGDNSNTQYALLGLNAASEVGIPVRPEVWKLARDYWTQTQTRSGGWAYTPSSTGETGSMTCAGISSMIITGLRRYQGTERLLGDRIEGCGAGGFDRRVQAGIDWLSNRFTVRANPGSPVGIWRYYYLYGVERAGRLSGTRYFGKNDWYREGARELVAEQDRLQGFWRGSDNIEKDPLIATSFALLFLAKGRTPVLINKLRHAPGLDWNNDVDDVRNIVNVVSKDWNHLLTWQSVDADRSSIEELMQAPILFMNGHESPIFSDAGKKRLRQYIEQGGFILAEACCGRKEFDKGFRELIRELFPEADYELHPLQAEHSIWRARHRLTPEVHPLEGVEYGCRTVIVYSPGDLSCFWNQDESQPDNPTVIKARRVGQNIIDYATGRELPEDKLAVRDVRDFKEANSAKRSVLHIAKLKHAGDWNIAPLAVPNLTSFLREKLKLDVVINHKEILPSDPSLVNYPLVYIHGRNAITLLSDEMERLRRHVDPGGGTIFADAACGSPTFDTSFRRLVAELFPKNPLQPIPPDDELLTGKVGYELADVQYTKAAGGLKGKPQLEGVKIGEKWVVIYSKFDLGCALERQAGLECKGYNYESALRITSNIVLYSTLP
ncbi:MAG: DUF4159 domain-containing protein [Planctomycetota bacterium]|nr:DUF4159 domain-containing protein [Planctomycetota bacterium]